MKKNLLFILVICFYSGIYAQIQPSVYVGVGLGTNLGGIVGIGTEIKYNLVSVNFAGGSRISEFTPHTGPQSHFDYDFGIKLYCPLGVFAGVNYGLIGEEMYSLETQDLPNYVKTRGFSFTIGYRHILYRNLYASTYLGLTSNKNENWLVLFDSKSIVPRMGVLIGYDFGYKKI